MDQLTLPFTLMLMCCVSMRLSFCELFHSGHTENMTDRTNCALKFVDPKQIKLIKKYINDGNRLIRFKLTIIGDLGLLGGKYPGGLLKRDNWILSTGESGKSLLFLPEDYIPKSLWTLSFSEQNIDVMLKQMPDNCFGADNTNYTLQEIKNTIRYNLLQKFSFARDEVAENFEVCNIQIVTAGVRKSGIVKYMCCSTVNDKCETLESSTWMNTLLTCLSLVKYIFAPLFLPLLILKSFYKERTLIFRYKTDSGPQQLPILRIRKTDKSEPEPSDFVKLKENRNLKKFKSSLKDLPHGEYILDIQSIHIVAHSKDLVEIGMSPVTFPSFIADYFGRCGIRKDDEYLDSCFSHCPSNKLFNYVRFTVAFIFLLSPWWITIYFFYSYDYEFCNEVEDAQDYLGLDISVSNRIDMFTTGSCEFQFILSAFLFVGSCLYKWLISVTRLSNYEQSFNMIMSQKNDIASKWTLSACSGKVEQDLKWGCFYFIPWSILKIVHILVNNIPLLKLYWKTYAFYVSLKSDNKNSSDVIQRYLLALILVFHSCVGVFLVVVCTYVLPFYIEIFVFTVTGMLLNFDDAFRYVLLIFFIFLYGHRSFSRNVSVRYRAYTKSLFQYILEQNKDHKLTNQNDSEQNSRGRIKAKHNGFAYITPNVNCHSQNFFFVPQTPDSNTEELKLNVPSMLLFRELFRNNSSSYIPKTFFYEMNLLPNNLCPGEPAVLYSRAAREFVLVILFISCWLISVSALGRVQELSASIQTIVMVGTGLLPFGLQTFILKSKTTNMSTIKNDSVWQTMFDKAAKRFEQIWSVSDIEVSTQATNESSQPNVNAIDFVVLEKDLKCIIYVRKSSYDKKKYFSGYESLP